jgi:enoyl-CoA hydratase/carnithine racemase
MAAMAGNAGAGGVFMALAADRVVARAGTVLSPHYKNMGNLYGSEYWTYTLPRRLGPEGAARLMETRMPILARQAAKIGLVDEVAPRHAGGVRGCDDRAGRGAGGVSRVRRHAGGEARHPGGG